MSIIDKFWADDASILLDTNRLTEFWISSDQHQTERLNAIMRFSIYISVVLSLYKGSIKYLGIILFFGLLTFLINKYSLKNLNCPENFDKNVEDITVEDRKKFKTPTLNNPYMNSTIYDLQNPKLADKRAIPYQDSSPKSLSVKKEISNKFNYNLYKDYTDIYNTGNNERNFYTMPAEFTAHDRNGEFRKFLYGDIDSSKSNSYMSINGIYTDYGRRK